MHDIRGNLRLVTRMLVATNVPRLDPKIRGYRGWSPLGAVSFRGFHAMVALLLRADGIRINAVEEGEDDPLWFAIQRRSTAVVELFLNERSRLDTNCQNNEK